MWVVLIVIPETLNWFEIFQNCVIHEIFKYYNTRHTYTSTPVRPTGCKHPPIINYSRLRMVITPSRSRFPVVRHDIHIACKCTLNTPDQPPIQPTPTRTPMAVADTPCIIYEHNNIWTVYYRRPGPTPRGHVLLPFQQPAVTKARQLVVYGGRPWLKVASQRESMHGAP